MTPTGTYRLHNSRHTITRGPLALVAGQAHRSAAAGTRLFISDQAGNTVIVHQSSGPVRAIWWPPQELFPIAMLAKQPDWFGRLVALIANLTDHDNGESCGTTSLKQAKHPQLNRK